MYRRPAPGNDFGFASETEEPLRALREQEVLLRGQKEAFQAAMSGQPLEASLGVLIRSARDLVDAENAAFYVIREDGRSLHHLTGMSESYAREVEGFPVGPDSFCSGLAAHTGEIVITPDVEQAPEWQSFLSVARDHGFRACWSIPVQSMGGPILGTMAIYFPNPRDPTEREIQLLASLTHAAAITISRQTEMIHRADAERSLRTADRRKDEFLAILSHELRNPLASMRNALELLRRTEETPAAASKPLEVLDRQMVQLVRLLDDLLDVSRISTSRLELQRERVELGPLLHHALEPGRVLAARAEQEIAIRVPAEPIHIDADPVRIAQVFGNLISNACRYTDRRGRILCTLHREGQEAVVAIEDNGIGIPRDELEAIFEIFAQVDRSLERSRSGLGIGLHLARQLVQMHGGTIRAHSEGPGKGSQFVVRLPIAPGEIQQHPARPVDESAPLVESWSQRILIVEDNEDSAQSLSMLLKRLGNETQTAHDGGDAIEKAIREQPEIVLLDIGLPKRNGYDVCCAIRDALGHEPIIVALSGYGTEEDRRKSAAAGFDAHVLKPVEFEALLRVLKELKRNRETLVIPPIPSSDRRTDS